MGSREALIVLFSSCLMSQLLQLVHIKTQTLYITCVWLIHLSLCSRAHLSTKQVPNLNKTSILHKMPLTAWQCPLWLLGRMLVARLPISCHILCVLLPIADTDGYQCDTHTSREEMCASRSERANIKRVCAETDKCVHSGHMRHVHMHTHTFRNTHSLVTKLVSTGPIWVSSQHNLYARPPAVDSTTATSPCGRVQVQEVFSDAVGQLAPMLNRLIELQPQIAQPKITQLELAV